MASNLALIKKDTVDVVAGRIREMQEKREIDLPQNYSAENAMKAAWLALQAATDKSGNAALKVCTPDSIANALLEMVVQGLNPAKKQCYFIPYGQKLVCMRSYFGSMAVAKNVAGATDIYAQVVYKGDVFEYEIKRGKKQLVKHTQKIENVGKEIVAAYCVVELPEGREHLEIMTMDQIKQAWKQGQVYKENGVSTHSKFSEEMCKKTVINRACKTVINSSTDASLLLKKSFNKAEETVVEEEMKQEIAEKANRESVDIEYEEVNGEEEAEAKEEVAASVEKDLLEEEEEEGPDF